MFTLEQPSNPLDLLLGHVGTGVVQQQMQKQAEQRDSQNVLQALSQINENTSPLEAFGIIEGARTSPERRKQMHEFVNKAFGNKLEGEKISATKEKEKQKTERLAKYGIGTGASQTITPGKSPNKVTTNEVPGNESPGSVFSKLSDDELVLASGEPDKEISEPAKQELKRRQEERALAQKKELKGFEADLGRATKVLERADQISEQIPQKQTALNLMNESIASKNLGFFSPDNLAEITGIEGLRSPEGALFKTAGKEYFLGNISRAGARPNQWIEQQISDMLPKIGRSTAANLSVARALQNELDLDKERVRLTNEISDQLAAKGDKSQGKLGHKVNQQLSKYAEQQQSLLFNDLRAIKAIDEGKVQKYKKVEGRPQVSEVMAQALLKQFDNDPKKAADYAKNLGYVF